MFSLSLSLSLPLFYFLIAWYQCRCVQAHAHRLLKVLSLEIWTFRRQSSFHTFSSSLCLCMTSMSLFQRQCRRDTLFYSILHIYVRASQLLLQSSSVHDVNLREKKTRMDSLILLIAIVVMRDIKKKKKKNTAAGVMISSYICLYSSLLLLHDYSLFLSLHQTVYSIVK